MTELRKLFVTGEVSGETAKVTNGGLDVNIQDQHTLALDVHFARAINGPTTLSVATAVGDRTVTVVSTSGFIDGTVVQLSSGTGKFFRAHQLGAPSGNILTLDTPVMGVFDIGSTALPLSHDLAVDGSTTPVAFQIGPIGTAIEVDITRILGVIYDVGTPSDTTFGAIVGGLTNGIVFRHFKNATSDYDNYWNAKTNGDIALLCYDLNFSSTGVGPSSSDSVRFRMTYGSPGKHGVTLRLEASDYLEILVQDDLTDLVAFDVMAQGHLVE